MTYSAPSRVALLALIATLLPACKTPSASPAPPEPSASTSVTPAPAPAPAEALAFSIDAGDLDNHFYQRGPIAAHVLAASGRFPRILFAFPAGDTGAGLWFEEAAQPARLFVDGPVMPAEGPHGMRGVSAVIDVGAPSLRVRGAVLGGIRGLRQYAGTGVLPPGFENHVQPGRPVVLSRTMLDGRFISLSLTPFGGASVEVDASGHITVSAAPGEQHLSLRATALTDEPPLTPIPAPSLLTAAATPDPQSRDALSFLCTHDKLMAGSWRFLTYFGRDTLISLKMLLPVLTPAPIEAGLASVLERLGADGQVAHEEAIGEWAVMSNRALSSASPPRPERNRGRAIPEHIEGAVPAARPNETAPVFDYTMVDDDFLLAPVLAQYLLDTPDGNARAAAFLARHTSEGITFRDAARRNLARVLAAAAPFAASKDRRDLVALEPGTRAGNWRDSDTGLGHGRVPFDVNAALVPAALEAIARLYQSPAFVIDPAVAAQAGKYAEAWRGAASHFRVQLGEDAARARITAQAAAEGLDPAPALASVAGPVVLDAIALDENGAPIPVINSDVGFHWLYGAPPSEDVARNARRLFAPYPAGLLTPLGALVANPTFAADPALRGLFTRHDYHGTVVWSWQQALLAAGIRRQLARTDLGADARGALEEAESALWKAIRATQVLGMGTAELWSYTVKNGRFELVPFGEGHGDADESNAIQLWSTVYLSVQPSGAVRAP